MNAPLSFLAVVSFAVACVDPGAPASESAVPSASESTVPSASETESGTVPTESTPTDSSIVSTDGLLWPGTSWTVVDPEEMGVSSAAIQDALDYAFTARFNTQGVVIVKGGVIIGERYASDRTANSLATSWSVGKSMLSVVAGIAIDRGDLASVDTKVSTHLTAWDGTNKEDLTYRHLLEMRSGLPEPTSDGFIYLVQDQLAYSLDREPIRAPGVQFEYVNADSMIVGAGVAAATGVAFEDYAKAHLFDPIGMTAEWWTDAEGNAMTYCCVDATSRDFARFGLLASRHGRWVDTQVVSEAWLDESTTGAPGQANYGLHWLVFDEIDLYSALGAHGQLVTIDTANDIVLVRSSRYIRHGDAPVREGLNYQETFDPKDFDALVLIQKIRAGL
jgi:CubicO group peptidase (beta-lactamase class C family)